VGRLDPALELSLVKMMANRMGARSLASLKYLVEQGHPYRGNARGLAPAPIGC
jgi:hypothetical protein